mmetsp:Transcript_1059/g.2982  ORF Transcript_1059/g.2982 Transcript_1059/m.2982 type:complete len:299 (+) Transcript_1059:61-957(+)
MTPGASTSPRAKSLRNQASPSPQTVLPPSLHHVLAFLGVFCLGWWVGDLTGDLFEHHLHDGDTWEPTLGAMQRIPRPSDPVCVANREAELDIVVGTAIWTCEALCAVLGLERNTELEWRSECADILGGKCAQDADAVLAAAGLCPPLECSAVLDRADWIYSSHFRVTGWCEWTLDMSSLPSPSFAQEVNMSTILLHSGVEGFPNSACAFGLRSDADSATPASQHIPSRFFVAGVLGVLGIFFFLNAMTLGLRKHVTTWPAGVRRMRNMAQPHELEKARCMQARASALQAALPGRARAS